MIRTAIFVRHHSYDFLTLHDRLQREPVQAFLDVLRSAGFRAALAELPGFVPGESTGEAETSGNE